MQDIESVLQGTPAPVESPATVESTPAPVDAPVATPAEPATTAAPEATANEQPRDERGRYVRQAQEEERPAHTVPVAALLEERRKRQELEARLQMQQPPPVTDDQFWASPTQSAAQVVAPQLDAMQRQMLNLKYELAEDLTRSLHKDYDAVRESFIAKVTGGDPMAVSIAQQMTAQPNPAKFVYDQMRRLSQLEQVGDPEAYRQRIEAEVRARVIAELQQQQQPRPAPVPRSLNSEPSSNPPSSSGEFAPTPLANLFQRSF